MTKTSLEIREATAQDATKLLALLEQLETESTTFSVVGTAHQTVAEEANEVMAIADSEAHVLLVAEMDNQLVGIVSVSPTNEPENAEIGVAVVKKLWHQGLGTAMMMAGLDWAALESPYSVVTLTVQTENAAAVHLYEKLGFKVVDSTVVKNRFGEEVQAFEMQILVK